MVWRFFKQRVPQGGRILVQVILLQIKTLYRGCILSEAACWNQHAYSGARALAFDSHDS